MTLDRRLAKLEAARGSRPDPEADTAFARLAALLDRKAADAFLRGQALNCARATASQGINLDTQGGELGGY